MWRRRVNLNGDDWQLAPAPSDAVPERPMWDELERIGEWLPARVPGNVRADLVRAGLLSDLTFGTHPEDAQWVDEHCWWLSHEFPLMPSPNERVHLVLRGVDYISDLFFNGHHLGRHEGMFSPQVHDVTALAVSDNWLAVRIVGSRWLPTDRSGCRERLLNRIEQRLTNHWGCFPHRRDTLKCQMSFGWDFAPPLRTMGIWDDVYAVVTGDVFIRQVVTEQLVAGDEAALAVHVDLDTCKARSVLLRCGLTGETFKGEIVLEELPLELAPGTSRHRLELVVSQPRLWWPWDHGEPDLYRLTVRVLDGQKTVDSLTRTVGLRQVQLDEWTLQVNGQSIFARGANWVPADILPGRVTDADYQVLLTLARRANMNMLRVWGGGLREKRAFYDLCDRLGILVWQEFPVACAFLTRYPTSEAFLRLVEGEVKAIIGDLRRHPSLVLWCGGNEFKPQDNKRLAATLRRAVAEGDPMRPFLAASPGAGDSHNWRVWHGFHPASVYREDTAPLASEFGLQAAPDVDTLRRFVPIEELWPPGRAWAYHGAELKKLQRYARPFLPALTSQSQTDRQEVSLEAFVRASQRAQAYSLQIAIEHYRRRKAEGCGGLLVWQFNEPWPGISWALVDYYRQPKLAYEVVRRLFSPLLVSVDFRPKRYRAGDGFWADVWVVNDQAVALPGCNLEVVLLDGTGRELKRYLQRVDVAADSAEVVDALRWNLPAGDGWRLECLLVREGQTLARNTYDLVAHDDLQPTLVQRLWASLNRLLIPA